MARRLRTADQDGWTTTMLTGQARLLGTGGKKGLEQMSIENPLVYWIALGIAGLIFGIGTWVGAVNADRRSFKEFMTEVRDDLKKILARLPPRVFAGESPIELTDLGKNISTRLNGKDWAVHSGVGHGLEVRVSGLVDGEREQRQG